MTLAAGPSLRPAARRVVEAALAEGAQHAEAFVQATDGVAARIDRDSVQGVESARERGVGLRVVVRGRYGFAYATSDADLRRLVSSAIAAARRGRPGGSFPEPSRLPAAPRTYDPAVARATPARLCAALLRELSAAHRTHALVRLAGGGATASVERVALANDHGLAVEERGTHASVSAYAILRDGAGPATTGHEFKQSRFVDALSAPVGRAAASLAVRSRRPRAAPRGRVRMVLSPEVGAELLELALRGLRLEPLRRGQSPFRAKPGEKVASPSVSIVDDPLLPGGLAAGAFDDDGFPARRHEIVREGTRVGHFASLADGWRYAEPPQGSSLRAAGGDRSYRSLPVAVGRCLRIEGPRRTRSDLLREARGGVLVRDVIGVHTANSATGEFQVTSTLLFSLRGGEEGPALRPVVVSGSVKSFLAGIRALSREEKDLHGSASGVSLRMPYLLVEGLSLTG
ncbi:MAG TPA: TldD/PmbA family protein [Candidatus Thermoplasmatota archaeon]|nr:TldD/PmbA family protein [Candidatus Thermoplasmatota archaeon]